MRGTRPGAVALLVLCVASCHREKREEGPGPSRARSSPVDIASAVASASHEGQRPPKPTPVASLTPPHLPTLKAQAAHGVPPKSKLSKDEAPCGSVWTGDEEVPLACELSSDDPHLGKPAVAVIPYDMLRAPKGELPATVDHRLDGFEGRTLSQGHTFACTAFALTTQNRPCHRPLDRQARGRVGHASLGALPRRRQRAGRERRAEGGERRRLALRSGARASLDEVQARRPGVPVGGRAAQARGARQEGGRRARRGRDAPGGRGALRRDGGQARRRPRHRHGRQSAEALQAGRRCRVQVHPGLRRHDGRRPRLLARRVHARRRRALLPPQELVGLQVGGRWLRVDPRAHAREDRPRRLRGRRRSRRRHGPPPSQAQARLGRGLRRGRGARQHRRRVPAALRRRRPPPRRLLRDDGGLLEGLRQRDGLLRARGAGGQGHRAEERHRLRLRALGLRLHHPQGRAGCASAHCQKSCPAPDFRLGKGQGGLLCLE